MNKPKWQRAQIIKGNDLIPRGKLIWIQGDTRTERSGGRFVTGQPAPAAITYITNIIAFASATDVNAHDIELLARDGHDDFADDVPLVSWEGWLAESEVEQ